MRSTVLWAHSKFATAKRYDVPSASATNSSARLLKYRVVSLTHTHGTPTTVHQHSRFSAVAAALHAATGSSHT